MIQNDCAKYKMKKGAIALYNEDALKLYDKWEAPIAIISDGPYGVNGFNGDLLKPEGLDVWYEPHIKKWTEKATGQTTLWFWNTEIGWATVHPVLKEYGWEYINCHIWNKGLSHIAGNVNTKTLRKLPIVTEVCVQYAKQHKFTVNDNTEISIKEWLRHEWSRSRLPFSKTNEVCGLKNAATRKYFTKCHLWYFPPSEAFEKLSLYANKHGDPKGKPYFSVDGRKPISKSDWDKLRPKFECPYGVTNVWNIPPLNGKERLKNGAKAAHLNQKPLKLMKLLLRLSSDVGDLIWEPFGGLFSATIAAYILDRQCRAAEIDRDIFNLGMRRIKLLQNNKQLELFT